MLMHRCLNRARARAGQEEQEGEGTSLESISFLSSPRACFPGSTDRRLRLIHSTPPHDFGGAQKHKKEKKNKKSKRDDSDDDISDDDDGDISGDDEIDTALIITGGRGGRRKAAINYANFGPDDDSE